MEVEKTADPNVAELAPALLEQIVEEVAGTIRYEPTNPGDVIELPLRTS